MKHIKLFEENLFEVLNEEVDHFGIINIHIDGEGFIKQAAISKIKDALKNFQGERHIFVDDKEINPYI
jgi:hypothetical protein